MVRTTQNEGGASTRVKGFSTGLLPALLAVGALLLGVASLLGWVTGKASLVEPFAAFDHMQPIGAMCLVGGALGLVLLERGWGTLGAALALGSAALASIELVAGFLGRETGFHELLAPWLAQDLRFEPRQVPPNVALAFALGGAAIALTRYYAFGAAALAATTATLGLVALLGYSTGVPGAFAWGHHTPMSLVQSLAVLLYGVAAVLSALRRDAKEHRALALWAPLLAGLVGTLAGVLFWQALRTSDLQESLAQTDAAAYGAATEFESRIASATSALQILAWNSLTAGDDDEGSLQEAQLAMAGFEGFEAVEVVSADLGARRVVASEAATRPFATDVVPGASLTTELAALRRDRKAVAVLPFHFSDANAGMRIVVRIGSQADERGYMVGVLDAAAVLSDAAGQTEAAYALEIRCDDVLVLPSDGVVGATANDEWRREVALRMPGPAKWRLAATPRADFIAARDSGLPALVLVASLAISGLLSLTLRFAGLASMRAAGLEAEVRERTADLRQALVSLRSENAQRRRSEATLQRALDLTLIVSAELNVESVVQSVTDAAKDLTEAAWGAFVHHPLDEDATGLHYTVSGTSPEDFASNYLQPLRSLVEPSLRGDAPLRLEDVAGDPRVNALASNGGDSLGVASYMSLPVRSRAGNVWGAIVLGHPEPGVFSKSDEDIAVGMAAEASIALDHARAHAVEKGLKVEAQSANAAKDQFLAMLSHELRNPLGSLRTTLDVASRAATTADARARMDDIARRQVEHLTRMVDDLLDVSRIEGGKLTLTLERVDLARLVREAVDAHSRRVAEAGLVLKMDAGDSPVWIDGDATRIAQIVGNLLANAIKFTEQGGRITVRVARDPGAKRAMLAVSDTGVGIAPGELAHVFEPFVQAEQALDRETGGLGLGLAVVKGLVDAHGGSIEARSAGVGRGATFTLRFPLKEARAEGAAPALPATATSSLLVLVIDDHRDSVEGLQLLLEQCGHKVLIAYDGRSGLDIATAEHPDLVICDLGLPTVDGYAVATELRRNPATADIVLFALSGYGDHDTIQRAADVGFDRHLIKPVDPAALLELLAGLGSA